MSAPNAAPAPAPSRYSSAAAARPEAATLGTPTQQQILAQQINLATTNSSPASMQTLLSNPRFAEMLRDPKQAEVLRGNPAFAAIVPKLQTEAQKMSDAEKPSAGAKGSAADGQPVNHAKAIVTALNDFTQSAPPPPASQMAPPLGNSQPHTAPQSQPPRSAQLMRPTV